MRTKEFNPLDKYVPHYTIDEDGVTWAHACINHKPTGRRATTAHDAMKSAIMSNNVLCRKGKEIMLDKLKRDPYYKA